MGELYWRYDISDYKTIQQEDDEDIMQFLEEWRISVLGKTAGKGSKES